MLKIAFITTIKRNPGDGFIREGIEYLVKQFIPIYKPYYIDKHDPDTLNFPYIDSHGRRRRDRTFNIFAPLKKTNILHEVDVVIQAGTPFYYYFPEVSTRQSYSSSHKTDWIMNIWLNHIIKDKFNMNVFNIAVGSCQPFFNSLDEFLNNKELIDFVIQAHRKSSLTIVRDKVAFDILSALNLKSSLLPCPSIFAPDHRAVHPARCEYVAINYMDQGGHYTLGQDIDENKWGRVVNAAYETLKEKYRVVFVAHSPRRVLEIRRKYHDAEIFFSAQYTDYFNFYRKVRFGIFNRVHAAMLLAGFGRPSVVVGVDSRALMAKEMGLPVYFVNDADEKKIMSCIKSFENDEEDWALRLRNIKEEARVKYLRVLSEHLIDHKLPAQLVSQNSGQAKLP